VPVPCGDREFLVDLVFYHCRLHRFVVFELGEFEPEYAGKLNFHVQLVDDHLRGISTPMAVTGWHRLPANVREALPSAEDLAETVIRAVREIESTTA